MILAATTATAKFVTLSNSEGREIEVELLAAKDGQVTFEMRNGKEYTVAIGTLSPDSRKLVGKWAEEANKVVLTPEDDIEIFVHTRRRSKDTDGGYIGWKDIDERIRPRVLIKNNEINRAFTGLKGTLVLIGEDVTDSSLLKVLYRGEFEFGVECRKEYEWYGEPFKVDYLIDDDDYYDSSYGFKYRYYFLVIRNKDGSVGHATASRDTWERKPELIDTLKKDKVYDRNLRSMGLL